MPSQVKRAFIEDGPNPTHIGGQALIEGVMMRGKTCWAYAVRRPDGSIASDLRELKPRKGGWRNWPFIRGNFALIDSLSLGFKALEISANEAFPEDESSPKQETKAEGFSHLEMIFSLVLGITLAIVLFVVLPGIAAQFLVGDYGEDSLAWNLVDGIVKVGVFLLYAWGISLMPDIRRLYSYHGAEHKTIHCFEHNKDLSPLNAKGYPRLHVRCGTAFLLMVILISILLYCVLPIQQLVGLLGITGQIPVFSMVLLIRVLLLPIIVGVTYEITVKWAGANPNNKLVRLIMWPGLQMQRITTKEPDEGMLECAICAMTLVADHESSPAPLSQGKRM